MILNHMYIILMLITVTPIVTGQKLNKSNIPNQLRLSPVHYDIKLTPTIGNNYDFTKASPSNIKNEYNNMILQGESSIIFNIFYSTQIIKLHTNKINITSVKLIKSDGVIYNIKKFTPDLEMNIDSIDTLFPGLYTLKMEFIRVNVDDNVEGFFKKSHVSKDGNSTWIIATHIQATGARLLFPCWDEPRYKATFAISIKHHHNFKALSNMPIRDQNRNGYIIWTYFHNTPPLSTHQIAMAVTNFPRISITENINIWCAICSREYYFKFGGQIIKDITFHLESEFDEITIPKIDHIALPNFSNDGTSQWGLIFYK